MPPANERHLAAGEVLFCIGDDGDDVFVILDGDLDVIAPTASGEMVVGALGPNDVVGEISAVIGGKRTATVRARTTARVTAMTSLEFERWLADDPARSERVATEARRRLDRTRVARVVADLVGLEHRDLIDDMVDAVEWVRIDAGAALFEQGDEADAAYILVGGQMRVTAMHDDVAIVDARIGRGDLVGEMGIIEQAPRSATARAIRDCTLARIPKPAFESLTARYPALMIPLVRKVIERVGARARTSPHAGALAIVVTAPQADTGLSRAIAAEIARHGSTIHLDPDTVASRLGRPEIANAGPGSASETRLTEFLHEVDVAHQWVVLHAADPDTDWGRRVLRTADRVAVIASPEPDDRERSAIAAVRRVLEATGDFDLWAVQLNRAGTRRASGTSRLRQLVGASRVLHLRQADAASTRRIARLLSGQGTGVAFSGGGARSYGQIGALRAMHELGIEIDAIAGTSMGSVIGAFCAAVDDMEYSLERANVEFDGIDLLDYTLPLSSIFRAKKIADAIERVFDPMDIEDTLIPFVCLSTNLSRAQLVEHRRGDLVHAIRASVSLPGVFPPVAMGDDMLVDGGVLENLPARPLRNDPAIATVIAVDVAPPGGPRLRADFGLELSGVDILRRRARREDFRHPPLAHTVVSSMLVGSAQARRDALDNDDIDLYLPLNLAGVKLLDFDKFEFAANRGYADAYPLLADWVASRA